MTRNKNTKYQVISNVSECLEKHYLTKKLEFESMHDIKYTRLRYFSEVARYCGIKQSTVSQMHVRNLNPSYIVAVKMSEFMNKDMLDVWQVVEID